MLHSILTAPYAFRFEEVEKPVIADDQVLLKINKFGICGSDCQMYHGLHKYMSFPVTIGHEVSATVVEVGGNVNSFRINDHVTVEPQVYCGRCYPCTSGRFNVCEELKVLGVHLDGFATGYFAIEPKYLHLCNGLSCDEAALIEPLAVGIGAAKRAGSPAGKNVVVVGAGTIGNLAAQSALALGAQKVMITDVKSHKLQVARQCGIQHCVKTVEQPLIDAIDSVFGRQKADIIIDAAAVSGYFPTILAAARPDSQIVVTGNYKSPIQYDMPVLQRQEISLIGHMMYIQEDYEDAIRFAEEKKVRLDSIISKEFAFDCLDKAFRYIDDNADTVMKVLISINPEERAD